MFNCQDFNCRLTVNVLLVYNKCYQFDGLNMSFSTQNVVPVYDVPSDEEEDETSTLLTRQYSDEPLRTVSV